MSVGSLVADRTALWWDERQPNDPVLWNSTIRLGEEFFNEIIRNPIPLDLHTLTALKRSPGLESVPLADVPDVRAQGSASAVLADALSAVRRGPAKGERPGDRSRLPHGLFTELKKIKIAWPELIYQLPRGALVLYPTTPRIAPVAADSPG